MAIELTADLQDPRDLKRYYTEITPVRRVVVPTARGAFWLFSLRTVQGLENLPAGGPVVLAANHLTNFDVFPLQFALPRPIFYMGKEELFRNPLVDWFFRQLGGFPVYRGEGDDWAIRHARRVLARGQVLGIFPEGSRSHGQGLRRGKNGAARLALEAGCPIVPVGIAGTERMFQQFPRRVEVQVSVGAPLWPAPGESAPVLTERLMAALSQLLPPALRGVYAG